MAQGNMQTRGADSPLAGGVLAEMTHSGRPVWLPIVHPLTLPRPARLRRPRDARRIQRGQSLAAGADRTGPGRALGFVGAGGRAARHVFSSANDAVAFSPDARWLVVSGDGSTRLYDLRREALFAKGVPLRGRINAMFDVWAHDCFSPDGRWLMTADGRDFLLWDLRTAPGPTAHRLSGRPAGLFYRRRFSPDFRWLLLGKGARMELHPTGDASAPDETWDALAPTAPVADEAEAMGVFSPDSSLLVFPRGERFWGLHAGQPPGVAAKPPGRLGERVEFSSDGHWLASVDGRDDRPGEHPGRVQLFDLSRGAAGAAARPWTLLEVGKLVVTSAFSPDGR